MVRIGIIGYGYWGPNLSRNFAKLEDCQVVAVADANPRRLSAAARSHPGIRVTESSDELLQSPDVDAVAIATPISTHYRLARQALLNGKHLVVEKPMTQTAAEAEQLIELAEAESLTLMVDHTFVYSGAVRKIRELIDAGELGDIYYYDSVRVNLGLFQPDVNVLWDLAPHDFSIMAYLVDKEPSGVSAVGSSPVSWDGWKQESVAYVTVEFDGATIAHFHVNWLSPVKIRRTLIGGSRKMLIYDHLDPDNQIKVIDKGVDVSLKDRYQALVQYRTGDLVAPKIDQTEALEVMCKHFLNCVTTGCAPLTGGNAGLTVVRLLEAAKQSMSNEKTMVPWQRRELSTQLSESLTT
ncbi:MAG: gfo/Idh/MocA family oxidoreductase [Acidobacteria bacterium]|nr:MAG: gfo/Idh/MocA family oxidoreductase [Acidobacteriota bacterium]